MKQLKCKCNLNLRFNSKIVFELKLIDSLPENLQKQFKPSLVSHCFIMTVWWSSWINNSVRMNHMARMTTVETHN